MKAIEGKVESVSQLSAERTERLGEAITAQWGGTVATVTAAAQSSSDSAQALDRTCLSAASAGRCAVDAGIVATELSGGQLAEGVRHDTASLTGRRSTG